MHPHFYYVKSSPFFNPPSARRPTSENLPAADGLTHGNDFLYSKKIPPLRQEEVARLKGVTEESVYLSSFNSYEKSGYPVRDNHSAVIFTLKSYFSTTLTLLVVGTTP